MKLIKLSATTTTQDYLKKLAEVDTLKNFTTVWAECQTEGRGQMGAKWTTNTNNGLTFSVLVHLNYNLLQHIYKFNALVVCSILNAFKAFNLTKVYVKWPNDILADDKKIGGILIENTFRGSVDIQSIIGIGINLNDTNFDNLPQAGSVLSVFNKKIDAEDLLKEIVHQMELFFNDFPNNEALIWSQYHDSLYKKNVISNFELPDGSLFQGTITRVSDEGKLVVKDKNDDELLYSLKEIKLLY